MVLDSLSGLCDPKPACLLSVNLPVHVTACWIVNVLSPIFFTPFIFHLFSLRSTLPITGMGWLLVWASCLMFTAAISPYTSKQSPKSNLPRSISLYIWTNCSDPMQLPPGTTVPVPHQHWLMLCGWNLIAPVLRLIFQIEPLRSLNFGSNKAEINKPTQNDNT